VLEFETFVKAKVLDVRTLAQKDRKPGDLPGAQLLLQSTVAADTLACFDGFLASMLFTQKPAAQASIEGVPALDLTAIGEHVKRLPWAYEQTGCAVVIDRGIGGKRGNLDLADCKVHRVSMMAQRGGSVLLQYTIDAPALQDQTRGILTGLKRTDIDLTIAGPKPEDNPQRELEPAAA